MKVRLTSTGYDMTSELEKYADGKAADMAKPLPHKLRATADCWIHFTQVTKKDVVYNTCTVTFRVQDTELKAEETTLHMYSALDIASVHIEQQLEDYIARRKKHRLRTGLKRRFGSDA